MLHHYSTIIRHKSCLYLNALAALLCIITLPGVAADAQLKVYSELEEAANFPDGNTTAVPIGPGYAITTAVLAEAGYKADIRVVPWPRVVHSLDTEQNVLGFSMTRTPEREDLYHWIGLIRPISFKLWTLAELANELPDTLEEATHLRVSSIRNDVVENYLIGKGFDNRVYLNENANVITMLRRGRIDILPYIESGMPSFLARKNEPPGTLVPIIDLEEISTGHYIVMSKQSDPELVRLLQDSYQALAERGVFKELLDSVQD